VGLRVVRVLDLVVLALALPVFVLAGLPLLGYAVAAGAWLLQRGVGSLLARRAAASDDPRTVVGLLTASMIGRGWTVALAIFAAGLLIEREAGLSAAILLLAIFTVYFTAQAILRPFEPKRGRS